MGYGGGVFLIAVGLVLALAVQDSIDAIDLTLIGWIVAGAGVLLLVLTVATNSSRRGNATVATTTHRDGTQTTTESRSRQDPPAV